jgi:prolyl-tRNA editing enzyme YbaK/EbsC (Cys-tRNA(Pro) deacylase)
VKTSASRALDRLGIAHERKKIAVDPEDLSPEAVVRGVGMPAEQG